MAAPARARIATLPGAAQLSVGISADEVVDGAEIPILAAEIPILALDSLRGPPILTVIDGRAPTGLGEVALGTSTMRQLRARIGSRILISMPTVGAARFRVVGRAAFPVSFGPTADGGLGIGIATTLQAANAAFCPPNKTTNGCPVAPTNVFVTFSSRREEARGLNTALRERSTALSSIDLQAPLQPTSLINLGGESVNFPLIIDVVIALFAVHALLQFLLESVTRRRREIGTLKSIGFIRRQVATMIGWQATLLGTIAVVFGLVLEMVIGREAWQSFAASYGVVPVIVTPVEEISAIPLLSLAAIAALAIAPALFAARTVAAEVLRAK